MSVYNQRLDDICKGYRLFHKIFGAVISRRPFPWACAMYTVNLRGEFTTQENKSKANRLYELIWELVVVPPDLF